MFRVYSMKIRKTRIKGIGYANIAHACWQAIDLDGNVQVGPHYASERELLACVDAWAERQGYGV